MHYETVKINELGREELKSRLLSILLYSLKKIQKFDDKMAEMEKIILTAKEEELKELMPKYIVIMNRQMENIEVIEENVDLVSVSDDQKIRIYKNISEAKKRFDGFGKLKNG